MKFMLRAVSVILLASGLAMVGPSAMAVTGVETHTPNVSIVGDTCTKAVVEVIGDWYEDYSNEISVDIYGPNGGRQKSKYFTDEYSGVVNVTLRLCRFNVAGTYTVRVKVTGYDEEYLETSHVEDKDRFKFVKKPKKKSAIRGEVRYQPRKRYDYAVPARLMRSGRGYVGKRIYLLVRYEGLWIDVDKGRTKKRGLFGWQFKPNRFTWAYYFDGDRTTKAYGAKFRTPVRGRALAKPNANVLEQVEIGSYDARVRAEAAQVVARSWTRTS